MLPSKYYTVVPLYNYTVIDDPLLYTIEYRSNSSCEIEYLKPGVLYSFQVMAFDSNNIRDSLIISKATVVLKNATVRLVGGQLPNEGNVEVYKNGSWNKICLWHWWWHYNESQVVCRSLGLQSPTQYGTYAGFYRTSFRVHYLPGFSCSGEENSLDECQVLSDAYGYVYYCSLYSYYTAFVVCGPPAVILHNITQMAGVITSPGYPTFMIQTDSRWRFALNVTRGYVAIDFDNLDLRRRYGGSSTVYVQELSQSFNKVYRTYYHGSKHGMLLTLPAQVRFYSPYTSNPEDGSYGKGMRFRYLVYSQPDNGVPTLKNWTLSLWSPTFSVITANWSDIFVTDYDIIGFLMSCNSTQEWAKKTSYAVGESTSNSLSCYNLFGYTHYKVHVLVQLRKQGNGAYVGYRSSNAYITTKESVPTAYPSGIRLTEIGLDTGSISWQPIPRKDVHGVLLGYKVKVYSYYSGKYIKDLNTTGTSIFLDGLRPANQYYLLIKGYTAVGSGPDAYQYFDTTCGGIIKNQLYGKIHLSKVYTWSQSCIWKLIAPAPNTMVLLVLESLEIPLSFGCKDFYLSITDGFGNLLAKICGSRRSISYISSGSTEIKMYLLQGWHRNVAINSSFFMLTNGINNVPYSSEVWNISSTTNNSTSVNVNWEKYPGTENVNNYIVICIANNTHKNLSAASTDKQVYHVMVHNLLKYTEYKVVVLAMIGTSFNATIVNETMFKSKEVVAKTAEDVPSKPPRNITAGYIGSNTLVVNWKEVDKDFTNGIVIGYYVYYRVAWSSSPWNKEYVTSDNTKAYLKNLNDVTQYRIEVSAVTKSGEGPRSRARFIKTGCQQTLSAENGTFTSPYYPNNYPSNVNCAWMITYLNSATEVVIIFENFTIEKGVKDDCSNDVVKIFYISGKIISSGLCGQKSPFAAIADESETFIVTFRSDGGLERTGFKALYFHLNKNEKVIHPQVSTVNATTALLSWKKSVSVHLFYVLYKQNEVGENWKVVNTEVSDMTIVGLLPLTKYSVKVIGNGSTTVYWSKTVTFVTERLLTTPHPEETATPEPTGSLQRMYRFGPSEGDLTISHTWNYFYRCFKLSFKGDGFLFLTKRHYQIYICRNGVMRFDKPSYIHWPIRFGANSKFCNMEILAPYWSLIDRQHSQVYYHVYSLQDNNAKSKKVLDQATLDVFRLQQQKSFPDSFRASWVLVVTWNKLRHSTYNDFTRALRNTFQVVLITDGVFSFAMFNYPTNGIQWSAPTSRHHWSLFNKDKGLPVVGWSAEGCQNYFEAKKSGRVNIGDISSSKGQSAYRSRRGIAKKENGIQGKWFFELYRSWKISSGEIKCKDWFKNQPDPRPFLEYLEPCPCTFRQAWFDERFTPVLEDKSWWSWRSNPRPCVISTFHSIDFWEQKCCYSHEPGQWGALLVGHPNRGYSYRYSKIYKSGEHLTHDIMGYQYCCIHSNLCHLFYQKRPSDDCRKYEPPEWSWMWGDPHFVTLDGKNYTFNGLGEYVMLDARDGFFQLHSRTRLAKGEGTATIFCAAVMKERNCSSVQLNLEKDGTFFLLIDGSPFDFESISNASKRLNGSVIVSRPQENSFKATYPSGISVTMTKSKGALSILVALPKSFKNQTRGLLGTWNGNKLDDFTTPSGYVVPDNATGRTIHFEFGQKWQVNETTSLFTYSANESMSSFSNTTFVPMFVDELKFANKSLEKKALAECNGDINCLFDAASTNDVSIGLDTKIVGSQMVNDSVILSNSPPKFSNESSVVTLKVNATKHLSITVEDKDEDSVIFNVSRSPKGAIVKTNSTTVSVSWLVSMEEVTLEFIAIDSKGAAAILKPSYYLCACHNGATCIQSKDDIERQGDDRFKILPCQCKSGYTGKYCENDIDACTVNLNPCYPGVKCKDLPAPANESGYECGPCPFGFSGEGDSCLDIDECQKPNHGCSQLCYNTPGSFVCDCKNGYTLENDRSSCKDVDECDPSSDCMHKCENTPGSYSCSCKTDFKVDLLDSKKCIPKSPCNGSHNCHHICYESNDMAICACHMGYQLQSDNKSCADVDECNEKKDRCNQLCHNTKGGYDCACLSGFRLGSDNVTCIDINECIEWTFNCSAPLRCENTIGHYNCTCDDGLIWNNGNCREPLIEEKKTTTPPSNPITDSPEDNAVSVTIKELNISEWDQHLDLMFKKSVARQVTTFCATNEGCLPLNGRERRSDSGTSFTSNDVILLENFPMQLVNMNALIAFYVKFPAVLSPNHVSSINGALLVNIINGSIENIAKDIGKILSSVSRYDTFAKATTQTPITTSFRNVPEKENMSRILYIAGGSIGGIVVFAVLLAVIIRCCKKQPVKENPSNEIRIDLELKQQYYQSIFFETPTADADI